MTGESRTAVNDFRVDPSSDDDGAHGVRIEVPRTRDAEFAEFVRDSGPYLHRTAYLLCGDPHRAEELVQSTFERVYRTWAKVRPGTERPYARRILVNLRIDGWRHGRRESFPGDDKIEVAPTADHAGRIVLRDELVRGLAQLSTTQRRVVVLRHLLDLPEKEVARELGLAVGTVKAANSRGLARLRDLLRAGTEAIEPVTFDEQTVLDRSRAALRRRRTAQTVGAACLVLLLALGVLTRGPVHVPGVGPVVLPGGQLIAPLLDDTPTDGLGPGPDLAGSTPVACPDEVPAPTPARPAQPGDELGPLDDPLVVDAADARPLSCYDVAVEAVTRGSVNVDTGLLVADDGTALAEPAGLSETGEIWLFNSSELYDDSAETDSVYIRTNTPTDGTSTAQNDRQGFSMPLVWYQGSSTSPVSVAARGNRVAWAEYAAADTSPRTSYLRTLDLFGRSSTPETTEDRLWLLALTDEQILWTAGATGDDTTLFVKTLDASGTPTEIASDVTALAADDDEAVAAVLGRGTGGASTTSIRLFDDLAAGNTTGTDLFEIEHDSSAEVTAVAISDEVVAWTVAPVDDGADAGTLHVADRTGGRAGIVRLPGGGVDDLSASGGLISWTSTDTSAENPELTAYLYRTTPSASGDDGPDLARFPGSSVEASLAGSRAAWLEGSGSQRWLVEATVTHTLERD